jgi:tRNA (cytidine/uridine-2'-O-)-methyltransferase
MVSVVLVHPQIPQNTGSIARSCASVHAPLHIIKPIPFEISEKKVRRAGLDYWPLVNLSMHEDWDSFTQRCAPRRLFYLSTKGTTSYYDIKYNSNDFLVFGSETKGLGAEFLSTIPQESLCTIPMDEPGVRSLNLSNAVSIVLFEALRQLRTNGHGGDR